MFLSKSKSYPHTLLPSLPTFLQVALLLGLGASPGLVDGAGAAPLAYAALHDAAVVRLLLNAKADVNQRFRWRMEYPYQSPEGAVGTRHNVEDGVTALMVPFQGWRWMFTGAQEIFEVSRPAVAVPRFFDRPKPAVARTSLFLRHCPASSLLRSASIPHPCPSSHPPARSPRALSPPPPPTLLPPHSHRSLRKHWQCNGGSEPPSTFGAARRSGQRTCIPESSVTPFH